MEESQDIPQAVTRVSVDLKQTTSGVWYVGSFKINVDSANEFNELFDKVYPQVEKKLAFLNKSTNSSNSALPRKNQAPQIILTPEEEILFLKLKKIRMDLAMKEGFPPYVVFHDSVLRQIARQKPDTPEALRMIIGDKKFERYGDLVLNALFA